MKIVDTHTHLDGEEFDEDRAEVIMRAKEAGVGMVFLPAIDVKTSEAVLKLSHEYPGYAYPMVGLHPEEVKADWKEQLKKIENPNFRILVSNVDIVENPKIRLYKESEGYIYEFFGTSVANKNEQQVLIATYSQISQNLNAFNLRYIPQNVIIICLDSKIRNHKQWFENNGFTYIELTDINKLADNICFEKNKKIIYYKLG